MTAERECNLKLGENPEMGTFRLEWIKNIDNQVLGKGGGGLTLNAMTSAKDILHN
jgi:hypothetical protein